MSERAPNIAANRARRHRAETRFRRYGQLALGISCALLFVLLGSLILPGLAGFYRSELTLPLPEPVPVVGDLTSAGALVRDLLKKDCSEEEEKQCLRLLSSDYDLAALEQVGAHAGQWKRDSASEPDRISVPLIDTVERFQRGALAADDPALSSAQRGLLQRLDRQGRLYRFADPVRFLTHGDSRAPEKAGVGAAICGSLLLLAVTMAIAFPIGILAAVYLEEFARKGRLRDVIEVNINNLAAVPSIIFGLLGLAVYLNLFGLPRSSALAGGLTLALLILPVIVITTRASLGTVPPSIKSGALALGASPLQVVLHHSLPLSLPGILTGTILGMARAIGETAPLLMIGMLAFIADKPHGLNEPASALPALIYLWAGSPERGFADKTASAILVLLVLLLCLNGLAIFLRQKYERRW